MYFCFSVHQMWGAHRKCIFNKLENKSREGIHHEEPYCDHTALRFVSAWVSSGRDRGVRMFVIYLHLASPPPTAVPLPQPTRCRLWTFSGATSSFHGGSCFLRRICSQQKGNRCAVISTDGYSCNIAQKCKKEGGKNMRPRRLDRLSVFISLLHPARRAVCRGSQTKPRSRQLPVQHRRQRHNPTCSHPPLVHVAPMPFSLQAETGVRPRPCRC